MTGNPRVLVCDDDGGRVDDWARQIRAVLPGATEVTPLRPSDFAAAVEALKRRRASASTASDEAVVFDEADVLVLDSDLTPDPEADVDDQVRTQLNSEMGGEVAHLARGFTTVGAIVVVNEGTQQRTFDLTLMSRATSSADVHVSEEDISNRRLWGSDEHLDVFCPSWWPRLDLLPTVIAESAQRIPLDEPWVPFLGLGEVDWESQLLSGQIESLGLRDAGDIASMTFEEVAHLTSLGMRRKEQASPAAHPRVAASAVRRWVERRLLPSQNVVTDLPHLLQTQPWLVEGRDQLEVWNDLVRLRWNSEPPIAPEAFCPEATALVGRPLWLVSRLGPRPTGVQILPTDPVFCEDVSAFRPIDGVRDFVSDVEGPHARRFVAEIDEVEYMPRNRLAL